MSKDFNDVIRCIERDPLKMQCCIEDHDYLSILYNLHFHNLKPCNNRPDAHSTFGDTLLLLEHFEFDSSRSTSKGSNQHKISATTERELNSILESKDFAVVSETVNKTGQNYINSFFKHFNRHYSQIDNYKAIMQNELSQEYSNIIVGFVIEDSTPLGSFYFDKQKRLVDLTFCKEFLDLFEVSTNLDFVIFAMTGNDNKYYSFISKNSIAEHKNKQIEISKIDNFMYQTVFCAGENIT